MRRTRARPATSPGGTSSPSPETSSGDDHAAIRDRAGACLTFESDVDSFGVAGRNVDGKTVTTAQAVRNLLE